MSMKRYRVSGPVRSTVGAGSGWRRCRSLQCVVGAGAIATSVAMLAPARAAAQDNYEIQVYGSETVAAGATMFELHSNFTWDGRRIDDAGLWPTEDALHETL